MGSFRFLLAALVAYSHCEGRFLPVNLGVSAVIAFYFISGYLMSLSYERFQARSCHPAGAFYLDRMMRIYPSYLIVFAAGAGFYWLSPKLNGLEAINLVELLIVPNNFTQLFEHRLNLVIPPSWSLGAELQFYLLLPLLFRLRRAHRIALLYAFVLLHLFVMAVPGMVGDYSQSCQSLSQKACVARVSDLFGYRYLPFVGVIFLLGHFSYEAYENQTLSRFIIHSVIAIYTAAFFLIFPVGNALAHENVFPVLLGVMLFIPLSIGLLAKLRSGDRPGGVDRWLGKLAYPLFLTHYLGQWIVDMALGGPAVNRFFIPEALALSVGLAFLVAAFQEFVDQRRYAMRGFGRVTNQ